MKIIKESSGSYQVLELEWRTPNNKTGKNIGYFKSLEEAFNFAENYIKENGREDTLRKDGNYFITNGKFLEIKPVTGPNKPLTYEFYGPRSGKVKGSYSDIRDLKGLELMRKKYL